MGRTQSWWFEAPVRMTVGTVSEEASEDAEEGLITRETCRRKRKTWEREKERVSGFGNHSSGFLMRFNIIKSNR